MPIRLQSARKVATVGEDEEQAAAKPAAKSAAAAEAGTASPDAAKLAAAADGKPDLVDDGEGKGGPSAALDIPFTPMALAFRCGAV